MQDGKNHSFTRQSECVVVSQVKGSICNTLVMALHPCYTTFPLPTT